MARSGAAEFLDSLITVGSNLATGLRRLRFRNSVGTIDLEATPVAGSFTTTLPAKSGTVAHLSDFSSPPAIGNITPNTGKFSALEVAATNQSFSVGTGTSSLGFELKNEAGGVTFFDWANNLNDDFDARFLLNAAGTNLLFTGAAALTYSFDKSVSFSSASFSVLLTTPYIGVSNALASQSTIDFTVSGETGTRWRLFRASTSGDFRLQRWNGTNALDVPLTVSNSTGNLTLSSKLIDYNGAVTDGQLLIGSTATGFERGSLNAGSGITITPGAGAITIASTGQAPLQLSFEADTTLDTTLYMPRLSHIEAEWIDGGGGGGGGRSDVAGVARGGGGGGAGGIYGHRIIRPSDIVDNTLSITVGLGGVGGATPATTGNGSAGAAGNPSSIASGGIQLCRGGNAGGGLGGAAAAVNGGVTAIAGWGSNGGQGQVTAGSAGPNSIYSAGAGAGGGGISSSNVVSGGGSGGRGGLVRGGQSQGSNGATSGASAAAGSLAALIGHGGAGGGGGTTSGGNGIRGGGGGGAQGVLNGTSGQKGGNGGNGIVLLTFYYF